MTDFQRLILGMPTPMVPSRPLEREGPELHRTTERITSVPVGQTAESYSQFLRTDSNLTPYLPRGGNPAAMAASVRSWFQGESATARESRGNYLARDTALSLTYIAFHESRNPDERQRLLEYFLEETRGYGETLRQLRREESLSEMGDGILRLATTVGFLLLDLQNSGLPPERIQQAKESLQEVLRQTYQTVDAAVGEHHPEWRHLQEFARARAMALEPPHPNQSYGDYLDWLRGMNEHLHQAEVSLNNHSEYAEEVRILIQGDRADLPPLPEESALARTFITHSTASFVGLIATEIDLEDGDNQARVEQRTQHLMDQMERDLRDHPDSTFEASLRRLQTEEARHLRDRITHSVVLRELIASDREALRDSNSLSTGQIVSRWGEEVVGHMERHSLHWGENFLCQGEQHLGATRAILQFFRISERDLSPLSQALQDFAGHSPRNSASVRLSQRAGNEFNSLDSTGFGAANGLSHFFSVRTVPFVAGGAVLSRLSSWALLAGAGETGTLAWRGIPLLRSAPLLRSIPWIRSTALVSGGELTGAGHFASATLTGAGLSLIFSGTQFVRDVNAGRPEAFANFGRNLGLSLLVNAAALGLSAVLSAGMRRVLATPRALEREAIAEVKPGRFSGLLLRLSNRLGTPGRMALAQGSQAVIGTAGMVGTNALIRGIHNAGRPERERVPLTGADEITETFLNLTAMNLAELPLQRIAVRRQLGRYRTAQLETFTEQILNQRGIPQETRPAHQARVFNLLALHALRGVPLNVLRGPAFGEYAARSLGLPEVPPSDAAASAPASPPPSPETSVTAPTPDVGESEISPPRADESSRTLPGTTSETSTQIIQPQRNFLIRLRERILGSRAQTRNRYVVVTLREENGEFDIEASLRSTRYQEARPEPRPGQIVLERERDGDGRYRIFLVAENLESVSVETRSFMNLLLETVFPRAKPSPPSIPALSTPPPPPASSETAHEEAPSPAPTGLPPAETVRAPIPAEPQVLAAQGESIEDAFRGLAEEVERESRSEPAPRESAAPDPTLRVDQRELRIQAAVEHKLQEYFERPVPGLLRIIQIPGRRPQLQWIPGLGGVPQLPEEGARILVTVTLTGDITHDSEAYRVTASLGSEPLGAMLERVMRRIIQTRR